MIDALHRSFTIPLAIQIVFPSDGGESTFFQADGFAGFAEKTQKKRCNCISFLYSITYLSTFILLLADTFAVIRRLTLLAANVSDVSNN
jgi:hypothetical protein